MLRWVQMRSALPALLAVGAALGFGLWWTQKHAHDAASLPWQFVERSVRTHHPDAPTITTERLGAWLADDARPPPLLLDAREPEEYAVSHLPDAVRIDPGASVDALLTTVLSDSAGRSVVVYCSVGARSGGVVQRLARAGLADVYNLEGSLFRWANEERPLVRGTEAVREVHPYSVTWGRLLDPALRADVE